LAATKKYNIDDSHGISHSMNVLFYANQIYQNELPKKPFLQSQERIIFVSSALHDMCDKKYMNESEGIKEIASSLQFVISPTEIDVIKKIISTMSYTKVKKNGFPDLGKYQDAYHIVREADLLTAYDFDRSMIYHMCKMTKSRDVNMKDVFQNANDVFENRILKHNEDGLFITDYSKQESMRLHSEALSRMNTWKKLMNLSL
jgi:HD superfamily phosphodiesterase